MRSQTQRVVIYDHVYVQYPRRASLQGRKAYHGCLGLGVGTECLTGEANSMEPATGDGDGCTVMSARMPLTTAVQQG